MIQADNLTFQYPGSHVQAARNLNFRIEPGFSSIPYYINYSIALIYHLVLLLVGIRVFKLRVFP